MQQKTETEPTPDEQNAGMMKKQGIKLAFWSTAAVLVWIGACALLYDPAPPEEELARNADVELISGFGTSYAITTFVSSKAASDVRVSCSGVITGSNDYAYGGYDIVDIEAGQEVPVRVDLNTTKPLWSASCRLYGVPE